MVTSVFPGPCIICDGDGYLTDTSDPGKTRKEPCPCQSDAYLKSIMDDMVESGYADKKDAEVSQ